MKQVRKDASVAPSTVTKVSKGEVSKPRRRRTHTHTGKSSKVVTRPMHPCLKMAHDLGIPKSHVQVIKDGRFWECIIWNNAGPWPEVRGA